MFLNFSSHFKGEIQNSERARASQPCGIKIYRVCPFVDVFVVCLFVCLSQAGEGKKQFQAFTARPGRESLGQKACRDYYYYYYNSIQSVSSCPEKNSQLVRKWNIWKTCNVIWNLKYLRAVSFSFTFDKNLAETLANTRWRSKVQGRQTDRGRESDVYE